MRGARESCFCSRRADRDDPVIPPSPTIALTLVSVTTVILLLQLMQPVLIPFVLSALLFYALDPAVDWLQKRRIPRAIGAALMLVVAVSACGALTYSLQGQALTVIDQIPAGADDRQRARGYRWTDQNCSWSSKS
jgi:predicted PurR-regulated permease PerM